ncbi:uncharacterized protein LOC120454303 [Drosophila santomea]|uniref:uncharacterized protein LOC120454303 n=1 Tax=Drosophila santomea TaxID=129105 RepID=UPI00195499AF|nr:uncharacterized protein LOC120454303 [Drosophila santomea]
MHPQGKFMPSLSIRRTKADYIRLASFLPLACCLVLLLLPSGIRSLCNDSFEPGCLNPVELHIPQRYCIDPTKYWLCNDIGLQAQLRKCQPNTGFDQDLNACVPWTAWEWKPCQEPPSRPPGYVPC